VRKTRAVQDLRAAVHAVHAGQKVADDELALLPARDQIDVHYQPIVELETETIVAFEALARWNHPTQGVLPPVTFLSAAEQTGFIHEIDHVVASTAITQLTAWHLTNPPHELWMSVNVSASGLARTETARNIADALTEAELRADHLVLEITETVFLDDTDEVGASLARLKEIGVLLALDDFGTAFSSLSYLRRFPFDEIKLDTSFTAELPGSARSMLVVEAVVHLADSLEVPVVAEGIERADQADCLRSLGCRFGQGFLYSPPVHAPAAADLLGI
jgi:EAL domain-containing protein (putative c-di-GMP-specific phosphodiesterase class I)